MGGARQRRPDRGRTCCNAALPNPTGDLRTAGASVWANAPDTIWSSTSSAVPVTAARNVTLAGAVTAGRAVAVVAVVKVPIVPATPGWASTARYGAANAATVVRSASASSDPANRSVPSSSPTRVTRLRSHEMRRSAGSASTGVSIAAARSSSPSCTAAVDAYTCASAWSSSGSSARSPASHSVIASTAPSSARRASSAPSSQISADPP